MAQGLVLVDVQNDYFPGGNMELVGMEQAAQNARAVLEKFRQSRRPVFHIRHIATRPGSTFFLPNTRGAEIYESVAPGEVIIEKHFPNSFRDTALLESLRNSNIDHLVICGAMSHMCIDATTRAGFDLGFACTVIEDACATRDLVYKDRKIAAADVHGAFMAALSVPYATVLSAAEYLKTLA
jgi:nicotinamidase-related amidase